MKLLLFDLDGTILRSVQGAAPFNAAMEEIFGIAADDSGIRFDGKTDPVIIRELLAAKGIVAEIDHVTLAAFELRLVEHMSEALARGTTRVEAIPGVRPALETLAADRCFALAVLTGNLERTAHMKMRAAGLDAFFVVGAFGSDSAVRAELPEVARARFRARSGIDVAPADCVIIGDTPLDHAAAVANGMPAVLIASGRTPLAVLARLEPAAAFADWNDPAAIHRVLAAL